MPHRGHESSRKLSAVLHGTGARLASHPARSPGGPSCSRGGAEPCGAAPPWPRSAEAGGCGAPQRAGGGGGGAAPPPVSPGIPAPLRAAAAAATPRSVPLPRSLPCCQRRGRSPPAPAAGGQPQPLFCVPASAPHTEAAAAAPGKLRARIPAAAREPAWRIARLQRRLRGAGGGSRLASAPLSPARPPPRAPRPGR